MKKILTLLIVSAFMLNSCCDEDFIIPTSFPDFLADAMDVTSFIAVGVPCTPSQHANFTTVGATPDGGAGECWFNNGPIQNVWFKFLAPASLNGTITVYVSGTNGTQRRTTLTVWDTDGTSEIGCNTYIADDDNVSVYYSGVTLGNYYYFSVDVHDAPYAGTFSLCLTDTD